MAGAAQAESQIRASTSLHCPSYVAKMISSLILRVCRLFLRYRGTFSPSSERPWSRTASSILGLKLGCSRPERLPKVLKMICGAFSSSRRPVKHHRRTGRGCSRKIRFLRAVLLSSSAVRKNSQKRASPCTTSAHLVRALEYLPTKGRSALFGNDDFDCSAPTARRELVKGVSRNITPIECRGAHNAGRCTSL